MPVLYNLEPLAAIDILYEGVGKNGVWKGDFIKNEKKNCLFVPTVLREFLENYGYLDINRGQIQFVHPDDMREIHLRTEDGEIRILYIGTADQLLVGIELDSPDLNIAFGEIDEESRSVMWGPSDGITLEGIMRVMFVSMLFQTADKYLFQGAEIDAVLKQNGAERSKIMPSEGSTQHTSVNYVPEKNTFLIAEYDEQGANMAFLHSVPRKSPGAGKTADFSAVTLRELNELFEREFFENALHCDFKQALDIKLEIVRRLEEENAPENELADHYKLAGRCLWALGRLDEAEEWYGKAGRIVENSGDLKRISDHYHTMGNFFADTKQWNKSDEMYDKSLAVLKENFPDNVYDIGMLYRSMSEFLEEAGGDPDRVIELCELALEQFQKDPHDAGCKYEIARAQQLRGKARRRKKELAKKSGGD